jgi:hypothetical protein
MMKGEPRNAARPAAGGTGVPVPVAVVRRAMPALAVIGLGLVIVIAPSLVPGLTPPAM